jgi:hypothetical protein
VPEIDTDDPIRSDLAFDTDAVLEGLGILEILVMPR